MITPSKPLFLVDGKVISKSTETVSPDGKHYIQEYVGQPEVSQRVISGKLNMTELAPSHRVMRSSAPGDKHLNLRYLNTIKVEGETFTL